MKTFFAWAFILVAMPACSAGYLTIATDAVEGCPVTGKNKIRLELTLDDPVDQASVEFCELPDSRKMYINGKTSVLLNATGSDKKIWRTDFTIENYYAPSFKSGKEINEGGIGFIPVTTPANRRLPMIKNNWVFKPEGYLMLGGIPKQSIGKFNQGLGFNGDIDMAAVNQFSFNPESGTIEAWVFLPMQNTKVNSVIMFIDSKDIGPWSYHLIQTLANSRKIQYMIYRGNEAKTVRVITSEEILTSDWTHVAATFDLNRGEMELFVNGKSQGKADYPFPVGGKTADLNIGGRIHNKNNDYQFILPCQMLIDEVRVSIKAREIKCVPDAPFNPDSDTALLMHFDGDNYLKNDSK